MTKLMLLPLAFAIPALADFPSLRAPGCDSDKAAVAAAKLARLECVAVHELSPGVKVLLLARGDDLFAGVSTKGKKPILSALLPREPKRTRAGGAIFIGAVGDRVVFLDEYSSVASSGGGACGAGSEQFLSIARVAGGKIRIENRFPVASCLNSMDLADVAKPVRIEGKLLIVEWARTSGQDCAEVRQWDLAAPSVAKPVDTKKSNCKN